MTTKLQDNDRLALIQYRLRRALDTLTEADYNAQGGYYNTAVNRLYYAAYYAASALMLAHEIEASTHAGVKTMLSLRFVKVGLLDPLYGRIFMTLYENRQSGDYEDFVYCDAELFTTLRPQAEDFINTLSSLINPQP